MTEGFTLSLPQQTQERGDTMEIVGLGATQ